MQKFQREVSFLSKAFDENTNTWEEKSVTKTATFKELSRTDREQHKLHFKIISLFNSEGVEDSGDGSAKMNVDPDMLYDITAKAIKTLLIPDESFTIQDRNEFLSDSGALFSFAMWFLGEKLSPFFSKLMP